MDITSSGRRSLRLFLSRPAQITGRVLDEETVKPIANLRVAARRLINFGGRRVFRTSAPTTTDANGRFLFSGLRPGEYAVEIARQANGKERILTSFSKADPERVDQDFENTWWPGGQDEQAVAPI